MFDTGGRVLCFCDARRAVLDLVRLAEQFRFSPQTQVRRLQRAVRPACPYARLYPLRSKHWICPVHCLHLFRSIVWPRRARLSDGCKVDGTVALSFASVTSVRWQCSISRAFCTSLLLGVGLCPLPYYYYNCHVLQTYKGPHTWSVAFTFSVFSNPPRNIQYEVKPVNLLPTKHLRVIALSFTNRLQLIFHNRGAVSFSTSSFQLSWCLACFRCIRHLSVIFQSSHLSKSCCLCPLRHVAYFQPSLSLDNFCLCPFARPFLPPPSTIPPPTKPPGSPTKPILPDKPNKTDNSQSEKRHVVCYSERDSTKLLQSDFEEKTEILLV